MAALNVKPQTKQELAYAYGVSIRTLSNWLKPFEEEIGARMGHTYTPRQVHTIYRLLGTPYEDDTA